MAIPTWPSNLPQSPLLEGFSSAPQDSVLRSKMDGYNKQRNRYTASLHDVSENYLMTPSEYENFKVFFHETLGNGAKEFVKNNPESNLGEIYKFSGVYKPQFNGVSWKVNLPLMRMP